MQLCMLHTATQIQLLPFHNSQILVPFNQSKGDKADGKCQVWNILFLFSCVSCFNFKPILSPHRA